MKPNRQPLYAKIAIARKQLPDMTEEAYRTLMDDRFGQASASKLTFKQLSELVQILAELGAVYTTSDRKISNTRVTKKARPDWIDVPDSDPHKTQKRAILAAWKGLGYSMSSLETRVKREFGVESFSWLHEPEHITRLLTDLQRRERAKERKQAAKAGTDE